MEAGKTGLSFPSCSVKEKLSHLCCESGSIQVHRFPSGAPVPQEVEEGKEA